MKWIALYVYKFLVVLGVFEHLVSFLIWFTISKHHNLSVVLTMVAVKTFRQKCFNCSGLTVTQNKKVLLVLALMIIDAAEGGSQRRHLAKFLNSSRQNNQNSQEKDDK